MERKYDILYRLYKLLSKDSDQQISGTLDFFENNLKDLEQFEEWYKVQHLDSNQESFDDLFNRWFSEREERLKDAAFNSGGYLEEL